MIFRRSILSAVGILCVCITARAGPVTVFTDLVAFLEAAGDVQEIDFETLPDGSPSFSNAEITPDFNYTDQGVEFFSPEPWLFTTGNPVTGFNLKAGNIHGSGGPRNWIIADLVEPALAVGILFSGSTRLSIFGAADHKLIATGDFGGGGLGLFAGFVSETPIGFATVDGGIEVESINSFLFVPIPEPATFLLLASGSVILFRRRLFVR